MSLLVKNVPKSPEKIKGFYENSKIKFYNPDDDVHCFELEIEGMSYDSLAREIALALNEIKDIGYKEAKRDLKRWLEI